MSFSNTDYIYDHLPARYRRSDADGLLKRYLTPAGEMLDGWDEAFDTFFGSIASTTASEEYVRFWLDVLFGWSWFPRWFALSDMRRLYGNMATHLARRGTARGIEKWLREFGIVARVHTRAVVWSEFVWGETALSITQPLNLIVEVKHLVTPPADVCFTGESFVWGEGFYTRPQPPITQDDVVRLVRFMQPHAQSISLVWRIGVVDGLIRSKFYWEQVSW